MPATLIDSAVFGDIFSTSGANARTFSCTTSAVNRWIREAPNRACGDPSPDSSSPRSCSAGAHPRCGQLPGQAGSMVDRVLERL